MRFPYKRYSGTHLRPVIPIKIAAGDRWIDYEVMVDSGSDICLFEAELADDLGLELERGEPATIAGAGGRHLQDVYIHQVQLTVGHHSFGVRAAFMPTASPYGLAGQQGFFSQFRVTFDLTAEELELAPVGR